MCMQRAPQCRILGDPGGEAWGVLHSSRPQPRLKRSSSLTSKHTLPDLVGPAQAGNSLVAAGLGGSAKPWRGLACSPEARPLRALKSTVTGTLADSLRKILWQFGGARHLDTSLQVLRIFLGRKTSFWSHQYQQNEMTRCNLDRWPVRGRRTHRKGGCTLIVRYSHLTPTPKRREKRPKQHQTISGQTAISA